MCLRGCFDHAGGACETAYVSGYPIICICNPPCIPVCIPLLCPSVCLIYSATSRTQHGLGSYPSAQLQRNVGFDRQTGQHQSSCSPFTAQFTAVISSHQSSSSITFEASSEACIVSCACLAREAWPGRGQLVGPRPTGALPWVHGARQCVSRGARPPALRGKPRSVLGAIVGGDRSCNELTS